MASRAAERSPIPGCHQPFRGSRCLHPKTGLGPEGELFRNKVLLRVEDEITRTDADSVSHSQGTAEAMVKFPLLGRPCSTGPLTTTLMLSPAYIYNKSRDNVVGRRVTRIAPLSKTNTTM
jgi:hypothetical protein